MVIDSFIQEIKVSHKEIDFHFIYIDVHGSGEIGVHQIELNPIYMQLHVMRLKAAIN